MNLMKCFTFTFAIMTIFGIPVFASSKPVVSIVQSRTPKASDLSLKEIQAMVQEAIDLAGGLRGIVKNGDTVVIKPNLVATRDINGRPLSKEANGVTADWRVVKTLSEIIRDLNPKGKILVMEGSAQTSTVETMKYYGYTRDVMPAIDEFISLENSSGGWRATDSPELIKVLLPNGLLQKEYYLNRRFKEADVIISVPTLKTHWSAVITGAIKNISIGAAPPSIYAEHQGSAYHGNLIDHEHPGLDKWIHDFYLCRPADFALTDGLQGLQNGPIPSSESDQMNMRLILASRNAVALDGVAAKIMGQAPESILYLRELAKSKGVNFSKTTIKGSPIDKVKKQFAVRLPPK